MEYISCRKWWKAVFQQIEKEELEVIEDREVVGEELQQLLRELAEEE